MILKYKDRGPNGYAADPSPFTHPYEYDPTLLCWIYSSDCVFYSLTFNSCLSHPHLSLSVLRIFPSVRFSTSFLSFGIPSHAFFVPFLLLLSSILTFRCVGKINGGKRSEGASCSENHGSQQGKRQRQEATYFSLISCRNPGFFPLFLFLHVI